MQEILNIGDNIIELDDDQIDLIHGGVSLRTLARLVSTAADVLSDWDGGHGSRMDSMGKL